MKLNENGDFCLLYIEPADEKQKLFQMIGAQRKPVVLMLPLAGQPRSRLFQRPEDFSDLKHVRRQSGVSIIFLTHGSERLAQMAARFGFPAYPSIDGFADFLTYGPRSDHEEGEFRAHPRAPRRARTGPLVPPAPAPRRSLPTRPLAARAESEPWPSPASGSLPVEYAAAPVSNPLPGGNAAPFHRVPTAPLRASASFAWPASEDEISPGEPSTPPALTSMRATPTPPGRSRNVPPAAAPAYEESAEPPRHFSEIPRRRSASLAASEPHTRHPGWEPEEYMFDQDDRSVRGRSAAPAQGLRGSGERAEAVARVRSPARALPEEAAPLAPSRTRTISRPLPEVAAQSSPLHAPTSPASHKRGSVWPLLVILSLLVVVGGALGSFIAIEHVASPASVAARPVGVVAFLSSEQVSANTSRGIDDQVQITLHNLAAPAAGKSFYAWLLGDKTNLESQSILLGKVNVANGSLSLFYPGDALHTNLLQITSRFLITEEDSSVTPLQPTPDTDAWRYYGTIPAQPDPNDVHHYSFLNHLRHLLADEPILDEMELPGGLNNWFTRNTEKLIEWTSGARDHWQAQSHHDLTFVRAQAIQILSYLDGMSFMARDMPAASASAQVSLDTHLAALGLLNVRGPDQNPPSYIDQMAFHLNGLMNAPGSPASVRSSASQILPALSNVTTWLQNLRSDDKKLLAMNNTRLGQSAALSLLDDMVVQASSAYTGSADPTTGHFKQGVVWIHQQLQNIATINVNTYVSGTPVPQIAPSTQSGPAFLLPLPGAWIRLEGRL